MRRHRPHPVRVEGHPWAWAGLAALVYGGVALWAVLGATC